MLQGAEDEDDHICLTALKGVDRTAFDPAAFLELIFAAHCDGAKRRDDEDLAFMSDELLQEGLCGVQFFVEGMTFDDGDAADVEPGAGGEGAAGGDLADCDLGAGGSLAVGGGLAAGA